MCGEQPPSLWLFMYSLSVRHIKCQVMIMCKYMKYHLIINCTGNSNGETQKVHTKMLAIKQKLNALCGIHNVHQ